MCKYWCVSPATYYRRRRNGATVEEALAEPRRKAYSYKDHEGKHYDTLGEMAEEWGIPHAALESRLRRGWGKERALTTRTKPAVDHKGAEHRSTGAMCRAWGVSEGTFLSRMRAGWDLGRALTEPPAPVRSPAEARTDHEGVEWPSIEAMCERWGAKRSTYSARMRAGWTKEEALTGGRRGRPEEGAAEAEPRCEGRPPQDAPSAGEQLLLDLPE